MSEKIKVNLGELLISRFKKKKDCFYVLQPAVMWFDVSESELGQLGPGGTFLT